MTREAAEAILAVSDSPGSQVVIEGQTWIWEEVPDGDPFQPEYRAVPLITDPFECSRGASRPAHPDEVWCDGCNDWSKDTGGFVDDGHGTFYLSCGHIRAGVSRWGLDYKPECFTGGCEHMGRATRLADTTQFYRRR
jgi:hypothetical protein